MVITGAEFGGMTNEEALAGIDDIGVIAQRLRALTHTRPLRLLSTANRRMTGWGISAAGEGSLQQFLEHAGLGSGRRLNPGPAGAPSPNGRRSRRPRRLRTVHDAGCVPAHRLRATTAQRPSAADTVKDQQTPASRDMEQARRSLHPRLPPVARTRRGSTGNRSVRYRCSTHRPARRRSCGGPTQPSRGWAGLAVAVREMQLGGHGRRTRL